jgi:hypothetical protein
MVEENYLLSELSTVSATTTKIDIIMMYDVDYDVGWHQQYSLVYLH